MSEDAFRAGSSVAALRGRRVASTAEADRPRMPTGPSTLAGGDRRRTSPWVFVTLVLLVLAVWWLAARVVDLQSRRDARVEPDRAGDADPARLHTPAAGRHAARQRTRPPAHPRSVLNVFASDLPAEQRASWVRGPGRHRRSSRARSGACAAGVQVVITELRFIDDDTAGVRIRFEGPGVPAGGNGVIVFDGFVHRAPERWLVDVDMVDQVLDLAASYCN